MAIVKGESFSDAFYGKESADEKLADYLMDLCELVYDRMKELGMNKSDLARKLGMPPSRITKILSGESNMTLKTISQLDAALDLDIDLLDAARCRQTPGECHCKVNWTGEEQHGKWNLNGLASECHAPGAQFICLDGGVAA